MAPSPLPNYIRTYRKRANLTQKDVAFLLGAKSSAGISRHERFKQTPDLETLLAYEMLFRTPARHLFGGAYKKVERKLLVRIRLLIQLLTNGKPGRSVAGRVAILKGYLDEQVSFSRA